MTLDRAAALKTIRKRFALMAYPPCGPARSPLFLPFTRRVRSRLDRKREQKLTVRLFLAGAMLAKVPLTVLSSPIPILTQFELFETK